MTPTELARKALEMAEKATEGPWVIDGIGIYGRKGTDEPLVGHVIVGQKPEADFVVFSRTALPQLAKAVLELEEKVGKVRKIAERMDCTCGGEGPDSDHSYESCGCDQHELLEALATEKPG